MKNIISAIAKKTLTLALLCLLLSCTRQETTITPTDAPLATPTPALTPAPTTTSIDPAPGLPAPTSPTKQPQAIVNQEPSDVDLALHVAASPQAMADDTAVYTLTVANRGPDLAHDVILTDSLPTGTTLAWFAPRRAACDLESPSNPALPSALSCDLGDLKGGDIATVTLDLMSEFAGVTLDSSAPSCAPSEDGNALVCRLGNLESGANAQVLLATEARVSITKTLTNTATIASAGVDSNPLNDTVATTLTIRPKTEQTTIPEHTATDLVLGTDAPERIIAGQPFTYTLTITNNGPLDATGLTLQDILPPGLLVHSTSPRRPLCEFSSHALTCQLDDPDSDQDITFTFIILSDVETSPGTQLDPIDPGWPLCDVEQADQTSRAIHCYLGDLASGQKTRVTFVATASSAAPKTITNTVSIRANETDTNLQNNARRVRATVEIEADLSIRSQASGLALPGQALTYTLTITNAGPSNASDVVITNTLATSVTLAAAQTDQASVCFRDGADAVICRLGKLDSGQSMNATIVVTVSADLDLSLIKSITNSVVIVGSSPDPDDGNNVASESTPARFKPDWTTIMTDIP